MKPNSRMANDTSAVMIGRSMKRRERITSGPRARKVTLHSRDRPHRCTGEEAQLAVGDHGFPRFQSRLDGYSLLECPSGSDDSWLDCVIRLDDVYKLALLTRLYGLRGDSN